MENSANDEKALDEFINKSSSQGFSKTNLPKEENDDKMIRLLSDILEQQKQTNKNTKDIYDNVRFFYYVTILLFVASLIYVFSVFGK
jgi:hypothetical protein